MPTFGNVLGFWALLAIPAILAIHFFQRESRQVVTSTLFLLEQLAPESAHGRRFERLRNSVPLWLRIFAVLLLIWVLVQPRWLRRDSVQHVVIVLDSSMSMLAFHNELLDHFDRATQRLARGAARTEWQLLESDTSRPALYSGMDRAALVAAVQKRKPHLGVHDFLPALQIGQSLLRGNGTLIFVSDRSCELPEGVRLLAVGHPLDNCGFCGVTVNGREWRTLVRNYGTTAQKRTWWMEANGTRSPAQELILPPGQSVSLAGEIPATARSCQLFLNPDAFSIDDRLPIVLPETKRLRVATQANSHLTDFFRQFCGSIESAETVTEKPDLEFRVYDPFAPRLPDTNAIVFVADPQTGNELLPGNVTAENNRLTNDLNWSGLLCRHSFVVPAEPEDQPLVWQGERPLIFLREKGATSLLVVNFDARVSNATRLPAFVLLLHRFVERIRAAKLAPESRNFDTNQLIGVASDPALPPPKIDNQTEEVLAAPAEPGFFEVKQGDKVLLRGAAQFADAREADFHDAAFADHVQDAVAPAIARNSQADFFAPLWVLAMGAVMIASWWRRES